MPARVAARVAARVRPLTVSFNGDPGTPCPLLPVPVRSKSAAIAECRAAGLRVCSERAGGLVELGMEKRGPWGQEVPVWIVTVHP